MIARLALFAAWFAALVLTPTAARAGAIWTFTETSCTSTNGGCAGNGFYSLQCAAGHRLYRLGQYHARL